MDFEPIINRFQQLASTRGGAVLTAIVLIFTSAFATGLIVLTSKIIDPIDNVWKQSFVIFMFIYFLLLALVVFKIVRQKSKTEPELTENIQTTDAVNKRGRRVTKSFSFERLSGYVVLVSISLIIIVVYVFGGYMLIKDMLIPAIQNISANPFEWDVKYLSNNIIIPLMMIIMWITLPFLFYLENRKEQKKRSK